MLWSDGEEGDARCGVPKSASLFGNPDWRATERPWLQSRRLYPKPAELPTPWRRAATPQKDSQQRKRGSRRVIGFRGSERFLIGRPAGVCFLGCCALRLPTGGRVKRCQLSRCSGGAAAAEEGQTAEQRAGGSSFVMRLCPALQWDESFGGTNNLLYIGCCGWLQATVSKCKYSRREVSKLVSSNTSNEGLSVALR